MRGNGPSTYSTSGAARMTVSAVLLASCGVPFSPVNEPSSYTTGVAIGAIGVVRLPLVPLAVRLTDGFDAVLAKLAAAGSMGGWATHHDVSLGVTWGVAARVTPCNSLILLGFPMAHDG